MLPKYPCHPAILSKQRSVQRLNSKENHKSTRESRHTAESHALTQALGKLHTPTRIRRSTTEKTRCREIDRSKASVGYDCLHCLQTSIKLTPAVWAVAPGTPAHGIRNPKGRRDQVLFPLVIEWGTLAWDLSLWAQRWLQG